MTILFVIEELQGGGKERRLVNLITGLKNHAQFDLHLLVGGEQIFYKDIYDLGITVHRCTQRIRFMDYLTTLKLVKPDLIHTWSYKSSVYTALLKPIFPFHFVCGFIGDTFRQKPLYKLISKLLVYPMANLIISNSKQGHLSYDTPQEKRVVIYNGAKNNTAPNQKDKSQLLKEIGVTTSRNVIMVANVTRYKDYETFINAGLSLSKKHPDLGFIAVGRISNEFREMTEPFTNRRHTHLHFLGAVPDPSQIARNCDVGVLCSHQEGISNAIIEFMRAGLPVISTDQIGATQELIKQDTTGLICSKESFEKTLIQLLDHPQKMTQMGVNGKRHYEQNFTLPKMTATYINAIQPFTD